MQQRNSVDELFRNALKDYPCNPSDFVWEEVKSGIQQRKNHKPFPVFYWMAASVILILSGVSLNLQRPGTGLHVLPSARLHSPLIIVSPSNRQDQAQFTMPGLASSLSVQPEQSIPWTLDNDIDVASMTGQLHNQHVAEQDVKKVEWNTGPARNNLPRVEMSDASSKEFASSSSSKWSLGSTFSPDNLYAFDNTFQKEEKKELNYSTGIRVGYSVSKRWSILGGVTYADRGEEEIMPNTQENFSTGNGREPKPAPVTARSQLVDLPVMLRFHLNENRLSTYISGGVSANIIGGRSSLVLSPGAELRVVKWGSLSVEPTYRRTLSRFDTPSINTLGVVTGLNYRF